MEPIGSIYTEVSDNFQKGIIGWGIFRCVKAEKHDLGVVMADVKIIGQMDNTIDHTFESANRVYDVGGVAPTMNTCGGGGLQPKILEANSITKCLNPKGGRCGVDGLQPSIQDRVYSVDGISTSITTSFMPSIMEDKTIVAMRGRNPTNPSDRTPGIELEQTLEVNGNGTSNCLTSVQKDNLVMEKVKIKQATKQGYIECEVGGVADLSFPDSNTRRGRVQENGQVSPTLMAGEQDICRIENVYDFYNNNLKSDGICGTLTTGTSHNGSGTFGVVEGITTKGKHIDVASTILSGYERTNMTGFNADNGVVETINKVGQISNDGSQYGTVIADNGLSPNLVAGTHGYANSCIATQYRIRKLTPRECWRLMDFSDEDFENAAEVNSDTQLYKQSGNSIVVNVLVAILGQLLPGKENVYKEFSE